MDIRHSFICILFICRFHTLHITLLNTVMEVFTLQENLLFFFLKKKRKEKQLSLVSKCKKKKKHNFLDSKCSSNKLIKMEHRHLLSFFYT